MLDQIFVKGARENNLKNIDVSIPRDKLVVLTGLSGSGKSSLAFDTIYAEGQRRYVESLSSYARMFLGQMDKPDVDYIDGLSPAISIDQKTTSRNPRSTVGTVTEIYDYLRLLWARIGTPHCPKCGKEICQQTIDQIIAYIAHCGYNTLGAPGEVMSYSNEGYAILSYIVDQAAGVPLEQFMQARIFDPLGMTRTILDNGVEAARALSGGNITSLFEVEDGRRVCDDNWSVLPPFRGCAMVKSTSRDMAAYYRMIANMGMHEGKQAIPAHAVDLLVGRYHPLSHLMTMCMGLNKREFAGHIVCEHAGGLHGVSSKGGLLLGEGYGFAVLCNQGDENMDALLYGMLCAVMELPLDTNMDWFIPAHRDFSAPLMIRGRYIGHEGVPSIVCIHCEEDGTLLRGTRDGEDLRLIYCGGARFLAVKPDDPNDVVCHLEFLIHAGRAWGVRVGTRVFERD